MPPRRTWLTFLAILAVNYLVMRPLFPGPDEAITVPYTAFKEEVAKGNVEQIYSRGASIEGRFAKPVTWPPPSGSDATRSSGRDPPPPLRSQPEPRTADTFKTTLLAFVDPGLEQFLSDNEVEISAVPIQGGSPWATLLYGFGPAILLIGFTSGSIDARSKAAVWPAV